MTQKQKRKISLEKSMHVLTGGDEPTVTKGDNYREQLIRALNWYNANREEKDYRAYAEYYLKHSPDLKQYLHAVSKADFLEVKMIGAIGRLVRREQFVDIKDTLRVLERLEELNHKYQKPKQVVVESSKGPVTVSPSIQDRIMEQARTHAAEVDNEIDVFVAARKSDFSMKSFLLSKQISGVVAKKIGSFYDRQAKELEEAIRGNDDQLVEGYAHFTKTQLKKYLDFVQQIIADCNQQAVSAKAMRKPRARKTKPPAVVAAKIKPMREFAELKLKSIDPAKIIGADELWVYTPTTRKLTVYRGAHNGTLSVSGMSIANYDVEKSETKTLRKPEDFFKDLSSTGKRAMANAWKSIRAKVSKPRARINDEMILLAVN